MKQSDEHDRQHEKQPEFQPSFHFQFQDLYRAQFDNPHTAQQHRGKRTLYYRGNYWSVLLQAIEPSSTIRQYIHGWGIRMV